MRWADKINGSVGTLLSHALFGLGAFAFVYGFVVDVWIIKIVLIGSGAIMIALGSGLLEAFFPNLFKTSGELDEEFNSKRRFGKKRPKNKPRD